MAQPSSITRFGLTEPFDLQVARGQITMHSSFCQFGINNTVGQANETIWIGSNQYSFPTSASVLKISSSSADDASPSGTGAQTVQIQGLDANYNAISEVVALNGQTAVNTTKSYLRVNKMIVLTAGTGGTSAGFIYAGTGNVNAGVPAVVVNQTGLVANETESAFYTVPAGYTAFINMWTMSSGNTTADAWTRFTLRIRPFGGVFGIKAQYHIQGNGIYECAAAYPIAIPEKADIDIWGYASGGSALVSSQLQILLVKNDSQTA
jgi:lipopolysaccharide export system protein LptA